jgi:hypothetical protein
MENNIDSNNKNEELIEFPANLDQLNKWTIPSVPSKDIYKFGMFDFKAKYAIKQIEQTVQISKNKQIINLINKKDLESFKDYNFIHVGLIQVALKPLTLLGLNSSIMAYVRDGRCNNFKQSLAALIETSLCHGPVYFQIAPNLSLSMTDRHLSESLQLNVHTNGYDFKEGSEIIAVCYRVYYKVLNTLNPKARQITFPGTTALVQTNLLTSNVATNRIIKWEEINFPETWSLPEEVNPRPILNKEIDQIIQNTEGDIEIRFNPNRITRIPRSLSSRHSIDEFHTAPSFLNSRRSTSQINEINEEIETVESIKTKDNIPYGIYNPKSRESPTQSDMSFHINV